MNSTTDDTDTTDIREISVIRGYPRNALIHRVLQLMPGALVNNSG